MVGGSNAPFFDRGGIVRKQIIKTLALVLVFALILSAAAPPKAAAVIPEGLLIAAAIALTMGTCVAITMIAADSAGMTGAIQVAAEKGLQDTAEFTENLIRGFNEARGMAFTQFLLMMAKGARITRDGALALGEEVSAWLTDFFDWSWSEEGGNLQASAVPVQGASTDYDPSSIENPSIDLTGYGVVHAFNEWVRDTTNPNSSVWTLDGSGFYVGIGTSAVSLGMSVFNTYSGGSLINTAAIQTVNGLTYYQGLANNTASFPNSNLYLNKTIVNTSDSTSLQRAKVVYIVSHAEKEVESNVDTNVLQLPAEGAIDTNILNLPDQITLPPVQGTATADSYLGAVRDAIYEGSGTLDYTDANDIAGTATLEMDGTATVDQVASGAGQLEGSTEVAEGVGSPTLDNYSIDLRDFFPFCIPFDLYDMLHLMSGSRAAPQVHWEFYAPGPNGMQTYNLDLDFSVLDPVASVLRTMELLAFGFALALATKKLLMGS